MKLSSAKVLILGNYRQSLTIIRSLGRAGYYVIAGRQTRQSFTDYSRYTAGVWEHPDIKKSENEFITALEQFLAERKDIAFVFPVGDTQISLLTRHISELPSSVVYIMPDHSVVEACQNKGRMNEIILGLGIPQAEFKRVYDYKELISNAEKIGYPCIIKPNNSLVPFFGEKAVIVRAAEDISKTVPSWPEGNEFLIVQRYVQGPRHNCQFLAADGEILTYCEYKVLRTDRLDGTGYVVDGISIQPIPLLQKYCEKIAKKLHYSGLGNAQFLVAEGTGSICFLEINPRLGGTCALPFYCGCDFPRLAVECTEYRHGLSAQLPKKSFSYSTRKRGVWLMGDIEAYGHYMRAGKLSWRISLRWLANILITFFRGNHHLTWWWKDPLPTCNIYSRFLLSTLAGIKKRLFR